jgi:hypothetical protein
VIPRVLLLDRRDARGPIEVLHEGRTLAYAVPANAGTHWAVWVAGDGPTDWSHTVAADSDAALVALGALFPDASRVGV